MQALNPSARKSTHQLYLGGRKRSDAKKGEARKRHEVFRESLDGVNASRDLEQVGFSHPH